MDDKKCGRPNCINTEYRIDGYCSVYCRDVHDLEVELKTAQAEVAKWRNWHPDDEDLAEVKEQYTNSPESFATTSLYISFLEHRLRETENKTQVADLRAQLTEAQAEVERLRTERNEWEITAKNYASNILKRDTEKA